jgi:hypothetical protein
MPKNYQSLSDLVNDEEYRIFRNETILNPQYHFINLPYSKLIVNHLDIINNMFDFLDVISNYINDKLYSNLLNDIAVLETQHINANTLEQTVYNLN